MKNFKRQIRVAGYLALLPVLAGCGPKPRPTSGLTTSNAMAGATSNANSVISTNGAVAEASAAPLVAPKAPPKLSPPVAELAKLTQAGVDEKVLVAFLEKQPGLSEVTAEEIVYLTDIGVPTAAIEVLVRFSPTAAAGVAANATGAPVAATEPVPSPALPATETPAPPPAAPTSQPNTETIATTAPVVVHEAVAAGGVPAAPGTTVSYNYFYESLSPYGAWISVADYGWCWRPTVAVSVAGWRPYCDRGRWLNSDYGWYWNSDYSWGYLPFHYGRWHLAAGTGWVWAPGTVWGPSWVTWRYGGGYCGWAPLPPTAHYRSGVGFTYYGSKVAVGFGFGLSSSCYTYVPTASFCDYRPRNYAVPHHRVERIHNETTVINNYITGNNNTVIINQGIQASEIARVSRSEIRRARLEDMGARPGPTAQPDKLSRDGSTLSVYRPQLPSPAAEPPVHLRSRLEPRQTSAPTAHSTATGPRAIERNTRPTPSVAPGSSPVSTARNAPVSTSPLPRAVPVASTTRNEASSPRAVESVSPTPTPSAVPSASGPAPIVRRGGVGSGRTVGVIPNPSPSPVAGPSSSPIPLQSEPASQAPRVANRGVTTGSRTDFNNDSRQELRNSGAGTEIVPSRNTRQTPAPRVFEPRQAATVSAPPQAAPSGRPQPSGLPAPAARVDSRPSTPSVSTPAPVVRMDSPPGARTQFRSGPAPAPLSAPGVSYSPAPVSRPQPQAFQAPGAITRPQPQSAPAPVMRMQPQSAPAPVMRAQPQSAPTSAGRSEPSAVGRMQPQSSGFSGGRQGGEPTRTSPRQQPQ